ncbi:MAG: hypothetical protein ACKVKG_19310, partial [Alphaproteobacteria bacterium]
RSRLQAAICIIVLLAHRILEFVNVTPMILDFFTVGKGLSDRKPIQSPYRTAKKQKRPQQNIHWGLNY